MTPQDLQTIVLCGEDSRHQFKSDIPHVDSLTTELAALANSGGGQIFIGVADDGSVCGLDAAAVRRINQLLSNAASHNVRPPVHPLTKCAASPVQVSRLRSSLEAKPPDLGGQRQRCPRKRA